MMPRRAFDPVFQTTLPLPVARLYARAHYAKGDRERHDHTFHLVEASLKLAAAAAVARYRARGERSAKVDAALRSLARPSLGQWRSMLLESLTFLAEGVSGDPWARAILEKLGRSGEELTDAFARLAKAAAFKGRALAHPTALDLLELLPTYRNAMSDAHGGIKADPSAYREPTPALLALAHALLEDAALLGGGRLVQAEEVRLGLQGEERVQWMDLTGVTAMRRQPLEGEVATTKIFPGRLYLELAAGEHLELYPLVHYAPGEILDQVFFLNRAREGAGGIQFLSYTTGEFYLPGRDQVGDALLKDLKELLSWVTRSEVTASRMGELASASQADARKAGEVAQEEREPSGTVLGDFEILGELGRGGMAVVYLARQMSLNRQVALKVLPPVFGNDPVALARFTQEVRALSWCDHPNVVKILASGEAQGTHYYAMEFIDGGDLALIEQTLKSYQSSGVDVLKEEHFDRAASSASSKPEGDREAGLPEVGKLSKTPVEGLHGARTIAFRWAAVIRDAARGVEHIHAHGIVHRDLKPQNIMVTRSEHRPVVMDLGLAKVSDVTRSLTLDKGSILGTLRYMPPEQLQRNLLEVDARADVYALGAVLYEMVCLRPLLDGDTEERLTTQILFEEPPPPQKVNSRIPTDLATVITKATRKDPKERYASAGELAEDLDRFVHGEAISAKPLTLKYFLGLFVKRHRAAVIASALAVLLFAASLAYWIVSLRQAREEAQANADTARKQTALAEERLAKVLRLSDIKRLAECTAAAEELWPCAPEKVAAMEKWLAGAKQLYGRLEEHRQTLAALREKALPPDPEALAKARERQPEVERLKVLASETEELKTELEKQKAEVKPQDKATLLSYGDDPEKKPTTCYFRHIFDAPELPDASALTLRLLIDDGAIVYLNGAEIARVNMPEGAVTMTTRAPKVVDDPISDERQVAATALKHGRNTLAVEVHQASQTSADLRLGLALVAGETTLVAENAAWSYWDGGEDPGRAWKEPDFDASAWQSGPAPLGCGFSEGAGAVLELESVVKRKEREKTELAEKLARFRLWTFADEEESWQHGVLAELVGGLEKLGESGLIREIEGRLASARTLKARTIDDVKAKWDEAIASIKNRSECPKYDGLVIEPELGLVPIGRDGRSGLWEFAHLQTGDIAERSPDGNLAVKEETGIVFVLVPGGTFRMGAVRPDAQNPEGADNVDPFAEEDEGPVQEVTLSPFFMSKYETTQGQWLRVMRRNPSVYSAGRNVGGKEIDLRNPVENVSWGDCCAYARRLGPGAGLPTEAQWEYAARAGTKTVWWTGNEEKTVEGAENCAGGRPAPVGTYAPNTFGLYDVAGNVWEWCCDWYGEYASGSVKDPGGPVRGSDRVDRGGSWHDHAGRCRSAIRCGDDPVLRDDDLGFRLARSSSSIK